MAELPIEDESFIANIEGIGTFCYDPAFDTIQVWEEHPEWNHVHYWDTEKGTMVMQFLGQAAMDKLHQQGVPHCVRDKISPDEYEVFVDWTLDNELGEVDELRPEDFMGGGVSEA